MNNQLIEKIITSNNLLCPVFTFENPLLDKNVAQLLAKSFVSILNMPADNTKVNNNLRLSILENLRKMCRIEPENHMEIDENITSLMLEAYEQTNLNSSKVTHATSKILDEFLLRNIKNMHVNSNHSPSLSPEVLQALINLNQNRLPLTTLYKDIIHWDSTNKKIVHILKDLWTNGNIMIDDLSIKLRPEIEKILLDVCHSLLNDADSNVTGLFVSNAGLKNLVTKSSVSAKCFQFSCCVLNFLFIMTNFSLCIHTLIQTFVQHVKENCPHETISVLYPIHLTNAVIFLDTSIEEIPMPIQKIYCEKTIKYMQNIKSETDFLMLLSHFPQWFDIIP